LYLKWLVRVIGLSLKPSPGDVTHILGVFSTASDLQMGQRNFFREKKEAKIIMITTIARIVVKSVKGKISLKIDASFLCRDIVRELDKHSQSHV